MIEPGRYDIALHQGATFELPVQYRDSTNTPVNMSGYTVSGTVVAGGLLAARTESEFNPESGLALSLGVNASGESDILALTIQCSSSQQATGLLEWREVM